MSCIDVMLVDDHVLIRENTSPSFFKHRFAILEKIHLSLKGEARIYTFYSDRTKKTFSQNNPADFRLYPISSQSLKLNLKKV